MSFFKAFRTLLNMRTLVVVLIFSAIVFYYYSNRDWSLEIPVTLEKRIDLIAALEKAVPDQGFQGKKYYLKINDIDIVHENEDDDRMVILVAPNSAFHYEDLSIHRNAFLKMGFGFYEIQENAPLVPVTFEVAWFDGEEEHIVFSREMTPRGVGRIKQFTRVECPLEAFENSKGRLIFRCRSRPDYRPDKALCAWANPLIDSDGTRIQLKKVFFEQTLVAFDFIEEDLAIPDGAMGASDDLIWARDAGGRVFSQASACVKDYQFIARSDLTENGSGAKAAIAMATDYRLDVQGVQVPEIEDVSLCFSIGLKEVASAAGGAEFIVRIDGEEVFREKVDGGQVSDRWKDRRIDMTDHGGDKVQVSFEVRFLDQQPVEAEVPLQNPIRAGGEPLKLRVEHSIAGFGHPLLRASRNLHRRLSSRTRPNLIIVNIECLHSAYLGCYGSPHGLTPVMDALADEGILFRDFIAASSWTLPSVATLLTGVYPSMHGATREDRSFLPNRFQTLPELMQEEGITTAAFLSNELLDRESNFDQGFENFVLAPYQNARKLNTLFENWITSNAGFRFFAYFHFFEPHDPCNAPGGLRDQYVPEALRGRDSGTHDGIVKGLTEIMRGKSDKPWEEDIAYLRGRYFGEIRYMDKRLGALLKILKDNGIREKTVIIITGDHGEEFMEHGYLGHGSQLYNESIQVPLIVWGPREIIGNHRIVEGMADNASLYATAAHLMGISLDERIRREVRPPLFPVDTQFGGAVRFAFAETDKAIQDLGAEKIEIKPLFSIMDWRYKLISDGTNFELYDRTEDPIERTNLAGTGLPEAKRLRKQLEGICNQLKDHAGRHYGSSLDARKLKTLQELGYTGK